jgi:hypothetical protein
MRGEGEEEVVVVVVVESDAVVPVVSGSIDAETGLMCEMAVC